MLLLQFCSILCLILAVSAKNIILDNRCGYDLYVGYQTNGDPRGHVLSVPVSSQRVLTVAFDWAGPVWARKTCDIYDCTLAGAGNPASLAEFKMTGANNVDYYDVSFVDGYNLPIRVAPNGTGAAVASDSQS